jgi:UDP-N-acetylmuramoylalanine--D-glutamate ligase
MADLSSFKSLKKPLAVLGLGVSGKAVVEAATQAGIPFAAWDDNAERRAQFAQYNIMDFLNDLSGYAALVPAAGIKPSHPVLQNAGTQNIPILSDIDLLIQSAPDARVIGITGTDGKSTTTALIGHILKANNKNIAVGGNIGMAACSLPSLKSDGVYVLELSSYQLEITAKPVCDIAVFLNLAPDHIDWHGTQANYFNAKKKITLPRADRLKQKTVVGIDSSETAQLALQLKMSDHHTVTSISTKKSADVTVRDGRLYDGNKEIADISTHPFLKGEHNGQNIAAAYAALRAFGLSAEQIIAPLMTFEGLPHRQKKIAQYKNITFIEDSKATNVNSAGQALNTFDNIYWILGGQLVDSEIERLQEYYPKVRHAFLIGEGSAVFAKKLEKKIPFTECGTMDKAVAAAFQLAQNDMQPAVILLSPIGKSFDQYKSYAERGDDFTAQVQSILQKVAA